MKNGGIENAKKALIKKLKTKGPISFYEFMKELLYGEFGYYTKFVSFGKKGDFITSPTVGDIFGRTVFNAVREMLSITGSSTLVEVGAGEGSFVKSIIKKAEETSYPIEYIAIEKSAKLRENLKNLRIEVFEDISELPDNNIKGVIFLNELLDAFPVYIIESYDNKLYEIFIDVSNDELVEVKFPIENSEIIRYIEELNITLDDGFRLEVNLDAVKFLSECYRVLNKGFVIIIDYGY
ncbi:MAG: SAM-dependent methyltransferase, partial [candidate division WOR-3 bacterium]